MVRMMKSGDMTKACAVLIGLCCLAPIAVLGAVIFLNVPIWPTSLTALVIVLLLARRIFALLSS